MKANNLEELVTNSNIAGELRSYTDWHTRLVKFAQLVAYWQKQQMLKGAVEGRVTTNLANRPVIYLDQLQGYKFGDKVRIVVLKEEDEK